MPHAGTFLLLLVSTHAAMAFHVPVAADEERLTAPRSRDVLAAVHQAEEGGIGRILMAVAVSTLVGVGLAVCHQGEDTTHDALIYWSIHWAANDIMVLLLLNSM